MRELRRYFMIKILYGTTNKGKMQAMRTALESFDLEIVGLNDMEGFPMDSLSIDISTGKYYYDLDVKDVSTSVDDGVRKFFKQIFAG